MSRIYYSLYDRLLQLPALARAFVKVRRAKGAPGVDGQTIADFAANAEDELTRLQPIFDPDFHPSSYGYRPGRSCQQAVAKAAMFVRQYGLVHVVDMDLSKCFDRLDHSLIVASIRRRVRDGSVLALLRMFLESGVMIEGNWEATEIGSPQGGVISPLISNVYLDAFDQEMKRRGHRIVRYADDILILCRSRSAAEHAREVATDILEGELRLTVNAEKTHLVHASRGVKFLGVEIGVTWTRIQAKKVAALKAKVKAITRRNSPVNLKQVIADLNPVLRGYANYFRMANCKGLFRELMSWIRRRLRAKQLALWKRPSRLHRRLRQLGYQGDFLKIRMQSWRNSRSHLASWSMPNGWISELGLFDLTDVETGVLPQVT